MMKEEIKNLIRQYAVGSATKHFSAELIESIVTGFYTSRLMYNYCIVPKSKLQEIDNIVCGTFSIGNKAVRQSWEYVKRNLFEEEK